MTRSCGNIQALKALLAISEPAQRHSVEKQAPRQGMQPPFRPNPSLLSGPWQAIHLSLAWLCVFQQAAKENCIAASLLLTFGAVLIDGCEAGQGPVDDADPIVHDAAGVAQHGLLPQVHPLLRRPQRRPPDLPCHLREWHQPLFTHCRSSGKYQGPRRLDMLMSCSGIRTSQPNRGDA